MGGSGKSKGGPPKGVWTGSVSGSKPKASRKKAAKAGKPAMKGKKSYVKAKKSKKKK